MDKKKLILIISLAAAVVLAVALGLVIGLSGGGEDSSSLFASEEDSREIVWVDSADPDPETEQDPEVTSPKVVYPAKPATEPAVNTSSPVTVGALTVSNECYTLTDAGEGKTKVSYNSVYALPAYAYVYVPVENYHGAYPYLKIKATCVGVQRISIVAVYYEQYDLNRPGVTVYNNAVIEGENTIICDLNESTVLGFDYSVAIGEKVTQKKIVGFMIFVDSNPKQVVDEYVGEITFNQIAVVNDSDPDLSILNSAPIISNWSSESTFDPYDSITIDQSSVSATGSKDAVIEYSFSAAYPFVEAQIFNYKSEYTTIKMAIKGENVKNLTVAIKYSLSTVAGAPGYNYISTYGMAIDSEYETFEFDFASLEELSSDFMTTVPGSYVKNLKPVGLYFYIDTADMGNGTPSGGAGTLYVKDVEFIKVIDDGTPKVTATWSMIADAGITKSNVETGGIGTLTYNKTQGWNAVTVNVSSYNPEYTVLVVKVKFYGAKNLGIALGYGSGNTVIQNSDGQTMASVVTTHTQETGTDEKGDFVFHTYTIDFTNVTTMNSEALSAQSINTIMFYIDSVKEINGSYQEVGAGGNLATERIMQFVGVTFEKPQASE